jgi:hypothetical protein
VLYTLERLPWRERNTQQWDTDTAVFESRKAGAQEPAATHVVLLRPASTQKARDRSQSPS